MEPILRAAAVYLFLLLIFRISGKRSLAQITTFDFVLLLIVGEATQNAMIGDDNSITTAVLVITTLLGIDLVLNAWKNRSRTIERLIDDVPVILVQYGRPIVNRMKRNGVDDADVMEAARRLQGLERMDQIKFAVLERSGGISIVPFPREPLPDPDWIQRHDHQTEHAR